MATYYHKHSKVLYQRKQSVPVTQSSNYNNTTPLQRAIENPTPETLTPDVIQQLQTTHGNQFTNSLIQQSRQNTPESDNSQSNIPIQRWQSATPTKAAGPTFNPIQSDSIGFMDKIKGLKKGKKAIKKPQKLTEQIMGGNQDQTREETMTEHPAIVSEQASTVASSLQAGDFLSAVGGIQAITAIFGQYLGLGKSLYKLYKSATKTWDAFKTRSALAKTVKALKAKVKDGIASQSENDVYDSASYGLAKVTRRFIESIAKTVILLGKGITTWVTFFTGGTTAVFTGVVDLLTSSAKTLLQGYRAGKALYKERKGTKGVNRAQNAQNLIEAALNNQPDALRLIMKLKVGSMVFKNKKKNKQVNGKYPKNTFAMAMFLRKLNDKELNIMRDELKNKLSSSVFRSSTEKKLIKNYKKRAKKGTLPV